jgi:hypothetical protein
MAVVMGVTAAVAIQQVMTAAAVAEPVGILVLVELVVILLYRVINQPQMAHQVRAVLVAEAVAVAQAIT